MTNESSAPAPMTSTEPKHRPIGTTIWGILALFGAAIAFIYTLQMLHLRPVTMGPVRFWTFNYGLPFVGAYWHLSICGSSGCSGWLILKGGCLLCYSQD